MHIPDGYLSPQTYAPLYAAWIGFASVALRKVKADLQAAHVPYLAMAAAFSFVIMMFNIPIPGGSTGHAVGAAVVAVLLGPWTAAVAVSVVLVIQALVFGDGGVTALGANCFNMAVVMPFVSWWVFRLLRGKALSRPRLTAAAFMAGYAGLTASAVLTAVELGVQPLIATGADGRPLYAPYPLEVAVPVMAAEHLLVFSVLEGVVTALVVRYFAAHEPSLLGAPGEARP
ncbi:MAG: cobalt transporter CbiM [Thermodesulfovibrionales bacterium]